MKTIKQIADKLGVSKQAVRRHLDKLPATEISTGEHNAILISEAGERIIEDSVKRRDINVTDNVGGNIDILVTMFQKELDEKNALIKAQQQTIGELTAALENTTASLHASQALHAGTMQQQLLPEASAGAAEEPPAKRRGFFGLFDRKK